MPTHRVIVIGAGMGGLVSALELASQGLEVTLLERAATPGGKMREVRLADHAIDAGPTVFTMRWVFEEIFAEAGARLADYIDLQPVETLARHAWADGQQLDLFADLARSQDAIARFAGAKEAQGFVAFSERARAIYQTLEHSFIRTLKPSPLTLMKDAGLSGLSDLWRINPFSILWQSLGEFFQNPRLRQLFGRYATYCGSSPFAAPATLMLVAHVEQNGVWLPQGGMHRMALALASLAQQRGVSLRYDCHVAEILLKNGRAQGVRLANGESISADAVIVNADPAALAAGLFGEAVKPAVAPMAVRMRSLSALTWSLLARCEGMPLLRHNVFFSDQYQDEFDAIFNQRKLPQTPTVYICAQDRDDQDCTTQTGPERLLCLVNAPAIGDQRPFAPNEIASCQETTFALLQRCGLTLHPETSVLTTPSDFNQLFPATGGALYGQASHGWRASFTRPTAKTRIPRLYLAGGSTHPGPGIPMAAMSGRLAAQILRKDLVSTKR